MKDDPIVDEVHEARQLLLAKHGGDLEALMVDAQRRTEEAGRCGRSVDALPARPPLLVPAASKKVR
jgi:hypothetical protein